MSKTFDKYSSELPRGQRDVFNLPILSNQQPKKDLCFCVLMFHFDLVFSKCKPSKDSYLHLSFESLKPGATETEETK